jgi:hypothetical protein
MNGAPENVVTPDDNVRDTFEETATEEDAMHPVIIQAVAAERNKDLRAHAAAAQRTRDIRRRRRARQARPSSLSARGPLRDPSTA